MRCFNQSDADSRVVERADVRTFVLTGGPTKRSCVATYRGLCGLVHKADNFDRPRRAKQWQPVWENGQRQNDRLYGIARVDQEDLSRVRWLVRGCASTSATALRNVNRGM